MMDRILIPATALSIGAVTAAVPAPGQTPTPLSYQLNWFPQGEHCGFFQAKATGLYEEAGLDVDLLAGGPEVNGVLLVAGGRVDLGMGSAFTTLNMVNEGIEGTTVAAFLQKSPQTLVAHPDRGVSTLADLKGRDIMVANFSRTEFWQFLRAEHGFSDTQLQPYAYSAAPFLADESAVQQGYITEDAFLLGAEIDGDPVSILLADYGYEDYASTVYGMTGWIDENRETVTAFIDATAEGYRQCIEGDYTPAKEAVLAANPDHSAALFDFKLEKMRTRNLVTGENDIPIGGMTADRWVSFASTMKSIGVYPSDLDVSKAFDLKFVD